MTGAIQPAIGRSYYFWLGYEASADQQLAREAFFDGVWNFDSSSAEQSWREIFPTIPWSS